MSLHWWHCWCRRSKVGHGSKRTMKHTVQSVKLTLYRCLVQPKSGWHVLYHLLMFGYVLLVLCLNAVLTLKKRPERNQILSQTVFVMEILLTVYFTVELILRFWVVGIVGHYKGFRGRLRFLAQFTCILDVLILTATVALLVIGDNEPENPIALAMLRNLRFVQILRLIHIDRRATTWKLIMKVLQLHKTELIAASYLALLGLLTMTSLVYVTEDYYSQKLSKDESNSFSNFGDVLWWGVITLTTVGYGDLVPRYWLSKIITSLFAIVCVSLFTLTSSVIGVGLALMVQDKSRQKYMQKQVPMAAMVLQTFWRQHMLAKNFDDISYYKYNLTQKLIAHELTPYSHGGAAMTGTQEMNGKTIKANKGTMFTFVDVIRNRVATAGALAGLSLSISGHSDRSRQMPSFHRRHSHQPRKSRDGTIPRRSSFTNLTELDQSPPASPATVINAETVKNIFTPPSPKPATRNSVEVKISITPADNLDVVFSVETPLVSHKQSNAQKVQSAPGVPTRYKAALKAIWRMKFMAAKKKFKLSRQLYDLNDMSEQVSHSESAQLQGIKKVQSKVERAFGKPTISLLTQKQKELGLLQRLELVESKMAELDKKADLILQLATHLSDRMVKLQKPI